MIGWEISKEFHFSASHQLDNLPLSQQFARLHGHNYILKVYIGAEALDTVGFVVDYGELTFVKEWIDALDHRHLNDIFDFNPTSENICAYYLGLLYEWAETDPDRQHITLLRVSLSETPKTWATASTFCNLEQHPLLASEVGD